VRRRRHVALQRPGHDHASVVVEHRGQVVPVLSHDQEVARVALPLLVSSRRLYPILLAGPGSPALSPRGSARAVLAPGTRSIPTPRCRRDPPGGRPARVGSSPAAASPPAGWRRVTMRFCLRRETGDAWPVCRSGSRATRAERVFRVMAASADNADEARALRASCGLGLLVHLSPFRPAGPAGAGSLAPFFGRSKT